MLSWRDVQKGHEADRVRRRRQVAFGFKKPEPQAADDPTDQSADQPDGGHEERPDDVVGLALSGGGIRSALFNDGFLQALSHRGFLRFVDYLSSVSGGGYIAGHLTASGARYQENHAGESFHDEPGCYQMGKNPATGQLDAGRIENAGSYLERSFKLWFRFFAAWTLNFLLFAGLVGAVSAVIAISWRSLDRPMYREQVALLGLDPGGDLLYAFLPCMVLWFVWLSSFFCQALCGVIGIGLSMSPRFDAWRPLESRAWNAINTALGFCACVCGVVGFAVFLGNSWTKIGEGESFHLNHYAQWLGIAAGVLQILMLLGRKQLFRSERPEASNWKRTAQYTLAYSVVGLALFAMVHWMCRENISEIADRRGRQLLPTDVCNWAAFAAVCKDNADSLPELVASDAADLDKATEEWLAASTCNKSSIKPGVPCVKARSLPWRVTLMAGCTAGTLIDEWVGVGDMSFAGLSSDLSAALDLRNDVWERRKNLATSFSEGGLASPKFARAMLKKAIVALEDDSSLPTRATLKEQTDHLTNNLATWTDTREGSDHWSSDQLAEFQLDCEWLFQSTAPNQTVVAETDRTRMLRLNRSLIELVYTDLFYNLDARRTVALIAADQTARKGWLLICLAGVAIGFVGTLNLNRHSPLYTFYKRRIAKNFLVGWCGEEDTATAARTEDHYLPLHASDPTDVGMPYPLMLGAVLDSRMSPEPLLFTPGHVGVTRGDESSVVPSADWKIPGATGPVKLADAVAISGSALAPLMTKNGALRLLFSFFNLRLGQWVSLPSHTGVAEDRLRFRGYLSAMWAMLPLRAKAAPQKQSDDPADGGAEEPSDDTPQNWRFRFAADGGFVDYLGVYELLKRRCRLIVVSDSGSNIGGDHLGTLARMLDEASNRLGVRFVDLDHEAPIDFERLAQDDKRTVPQPFICMRVRYPVGEDAPVEDAYLVYVQMAITDSDPIEIRQIRKRFPVFPDEPTVNQFYSEEQVAAYRQLGYHIGSRLCGEIQRWTPPQIQRALLHDVVAQNNADPLETSLHDPYYGEVQEVSEGKVKVEPAEYATGQKTPLFSTVLRRLLSGYRMACFEEVSYKEGDIYAEAVWDRGEWCFASFDDAAKDERFASLLTTTDDDAVSLAQRVKRMRRVADAWLRVYEQNADVRTAYRRAVFFDLNSSIVSLFRREPFVNYELFHKLCLAALESDSFQNREWKRGHLLGRFEWPEAELATAHLCTIAFACHQMRRGTPRAVFQIGGRDKLIDLVISIVLGERVTQRGSDFGWSHWAEGACPEIIEMKRCVFQGAETETASSFAYLMAMFAAKLHQPDRKEGPEATVYAQLQRSVQFDRLEALPRLVSEILGLPSPAPDQATPPSAKDKKAAKDNEAAGDDEAAGLFKMAEEFRPDEASDPKTSGRSGRKRNAQSPATKRTPPKKRRPKKP